MTYPRIYKADKTYLYTGIAVCFVVFAALAQALTQHSEQLGSRDLSVISISIIAILVIVYLGILRPVVYRVRLMPDVVEVTTLFGTKSMRRNDISSYTFYVGEYANGVCLISKNQDRLNIPLLFDRDNEFDNWVMSLPCQVDGTPLPRRKLA